MKKDQVEWIAKEGTIQTKETERIKTAGGLFIDVPQYIAFNVNPLIAKYIVQHHNETIKEA